MILRNVGLALTGDECAEGREPRVPVVRDLIPIQPGSASSSAARAGSRRPFCAPTPTGHPRPEAEAALDVVTRDAGVPLACDEGMEGSQADAQCPPGDPRSSQAAPRAQRRGRIESVSRMLGATLRHPRPKPEVALDVATAGPGRGPRGRRRPGAQRGRRPSRPRRVPDSSPGAPRARRREPGRVAARAVPLVVDPRPKPQAILDMTFAALVRGPRGRRMNGGQRGRRPSRLRTGPRSSPGAPRARRHGLGQGGRRRCSTRRLVTQDPSRKPPSTWRCGTRACPSRATKARRAARPAAQSSP